MVKKVWSPFERGMYCDDESIRYPYTDHETVSDTALMLFGVAMPVGLWPSLSFCSFCWASHMSVGLTATTKACVTLIRTPQ